MITNMAELIEEQKRMRERELQEYTPPPPSIEKVNILAFKLNDSNKAEFEIERSKLNEILKEEIFGPVLPVLSFVNQQDALDIIKAYDKHDETQKSQQNPA